MLCGGSGNDTLNGDSGNDTLNGGSGADLMIGGSGNDSYIVNHAGDKVVESSGGGTDTVTSFLGSSTFTLPANVENLNLGGSGNLNGTGNSQVNTLTGNDGNNKLSGAGGNDTRSGGNGDDTLTVGTGNDSLDRGQGNDTAVFAGKFADYQITNNNRVIIVTDLNPGAGGNDGKDTLVNVESLQFADQIVPVGAGAMDLSTLDRATGFIIQGDAAGDFAGTRVASAGDLNGDGFDDLIVGAPTGGDAGTWAGEAYVLFGKAGGFGTVDGTGRAVIDLTNLPITDGFIIRGEEPRDFVGRSVASGDINGDGFDDLIVGATTDYAGYSCPNAYVIFGKAGGFGTVDSSGRSVLDVATLSPSDGFLIAGNDEYGTGASVASAGDINGDGFEDLIIGEPTSGSEEGGAYVVFGHADGLGTVDGSSRSVASLATLPATDGFVIQGHTVFGYAGYSVDSAGDVNGDGFDDLIIGEPGLVGYDAGRAYVILGHAGGFGTPDGSGRSVIDLTTLAAAEGFIVQGPPTGSAGFTMSLQPAT